MKIYESTYKDRPAFVVQSKEMQAVFLPLDGGKMVSLCVGDKGKELLVTKKGEQYKTLTYGGDYVSSECSGFDDMFPTVDPYQPMDGHYQGIIYPDHGEICRIAHDVQITEKELILKAESKLFPLSYKKIVTANAEGGLDLDYYISNTGAVDFPFLWAGHIMLQGEDGMRLFTSFSNGIPIEMMFCTEGEDAAQLPLDRLCGYRAGQGAAYKYYFLEPMPNGVFGVQYPDDSSLVFEVDPQKIPYLGLWINNGEFQDLYSITPEPCTVPFDSPGRAKKRGYQSMIQAHSEFTFKLRIIWKQKEE